MGGAGTNPAYVSFLPNALHNDGIAVNISPSAMSRGLAISFAELAGDIEAGWLAAKDVPNQG